MFCLFYFSIYIYLYPKITKVLILVFFNYIKSKSSPPSSSSSSSSSLRFFEAFGFGLLLPDDLAALLRPEAAGGGANTPPCALILTGPLSFKPPPYIKLIMIIYKKST